MIDVDRKSGDREAGLSCGPPKFRLLVTTPDYAHMSPSLFDLPPKENRTRYYSSGISAVTYCLKGTIKAGPCPKPRRPKLTV